MSVRNKPELHRKICYIPQPYFVAKD
ncbi:hypothetical protein FXE99_01090 [Vibrio mimicus]|nr:hypothetical protein FXE99_01090 [Vibrio mimicus]